VNPKPQFDYLAELWALVCYVELRAVVMRGECV
jgi:hypothetical protein